MGVPSSVADIPPATSFAKPCKKGTLTKLVGRRWIFLPVWKERYCVLDGNKLYYYDSETSKGTNSHCGVINLDLFDLCEEYESKSVQNGFIITNANRGFFDEYHTFAAGTLSEVCDWIAHIRAQLNQSIVQKRTSFLRKSLAKRKTRKSLESQANVESSPQVPDPTLDIPGKEPLESITKNRAKGPAGRRLPQRKSQMPKSLSQEVSSQKVPISHKQEVVTEEAEPTEVGTKSETDKPRPASALLYHYSSSEEDDTDKTREPESASQTEDTREPSHKLPDGSCTLNPRTETMQDRLRKLREELSCHVDDVTMKSLLERLSYCELELQVAVQVLCLYLCLSFFRTAKLLTRILQPFYCGKGLCAAACSVPISSAACIRAQNFSFEI
ncbi:pleckstrin homology domain-containing family O member 1-like isoform X2 [Dermacentor albipictus]|uniref:pleckstrin homology domain-containing family O member 1-like isoform X2 n=1 Tax=Dermacentor albipictus TaxID=60249 RepID=UPI0031FD2340